MKRAEAMAKKPVVEDLKEFALAIVGKCSEDNLPRLASSFSFFGLLSLAPFLVLAVTVGALILGKVQTAQHLLTEAAHVGGPQVRDYLNAIIESSQHRTSGIIATVLSLIVTFFSASNLFINLDDGVNSIWKITYNRSFVKSFILTRIVAFLSVVIFGALLIGWLGVDSFLGFLAKQGPGFRGWELVSYGAAIVFFTGGFSVTLYALPRGRLAIRDAVPGAFVTAFGFATSKYLLSFYFSRTPGGVYQAAGGIVVLLLWMYYTTIIYYVGVEITYVYSHRYGTLKDKDNPVELDLAARGLPTS